jgi:alpha-tubulin suppressor-like RCC1 family protein
MVQAAGPFVEFSANAGHQCGILTNGSLVCMGTNSRGQAPALVVGHFIAVAVGGDFTCVLRSDQEIECFGSNEFVPARLRAYSCVLMAVRARKLCEKAHLTCLS